MGRPWRLLQTPALSGAANMALDEALLQAFQEGKTGPVFRLYTWERPTISLGRFQDPRADLDWDALKTAGQPVVRRMTGGGAILHARELTYSLVCDQTDLGAGSVKDSFARLCRFLIRSYRRLGLDAHYAVDYQPDNAGLGQKTAFCFAGKELYDILIAGRKLGGNAQRRVHQTVFQHGSVPLFLDWDLLDRLFKPETLPERDSILALAPLWKPEAGAGADWQALAAELGGLCAEEFAANLEVEFVPSEPTAEEWALAQTFEAEKYGSAAWTLDPRGPAAAE